MAAERNVPAPVSAPAARSGIFFALLSTLGFAMGPVFVRLGYLAGIDGRELVLARFVLASLLLLVAGPLSERGFFRFSRASVVRAAAVSILVLVPFNLAYVTALRDMPASMMSLVFYAYPAAVLFINAAVLGRTVPGRSVVSAAMIILSCACIFLDAFTAEIAWAVLALSFASTALYAVYLVSIQQWSAEISAMQFTFLTFVFTALPFCFFHSPLDVLRFSPGQAAVASGYVLFSTILPIYFLSRSIQSFGAGEAGIFSATEPVFTILFAALFLGESIPAFRLAGAALLVLSIVVPNRVEIRDALFCAVSARKRG